MHILIVDEFHPESLELLTRAGWKYDVFAGGRADFLSRAADYDGLLIRSGFRIDREAIDAGKNWKFIGRAGAGMENIDREYAESRGIYCLNSPEGNRDSVGEQAIGMLLMLLNNLHTADTAFRTGKWSRKAFWGNELMGKTVGIYGFGNTGSQLARKLQGFDCKILAYDKYKSGFGNAYTTESTPEEIANQADILSLHLPLTPETKHLVNLEFLNSFRKNMYLINTARGPIVDTESLVQAMKSGKVTGACLDVNEYESLSFEENNTTHTPEALTWLLNSDRTILTPHIAGWTHESFRKISVFLAEKIIARFS